MIWSHGATTISGLGSSPTQGKVPLTLNLNLQTQDAKATCVAELCWRCLHVSRLEAQLKTTVLHFKRMFLLNVSVILGRSFYTYVIFVGFIFLASLVLPCVNKMSETSRLTAERLSPDALLCKVWLQTATAAR